MLVACAGAPQRTHDAQADCIGPDAPRSRPGSCAWPRDVRTFVARRDGCDHFRSEPLPTPDEARMDADERERRTFLLRMMRRSCSGSDAQLAKLRAKYGHDSILGPVLADFEHPIE